MAGAVLLQLRELRFSLGGAPLFEGASLALNRGERACLVGRNGAGKSTLLRMAAGELEPDSGERVLAQGATVAWVEQEPDLAAFATLGDYAAAPLGGVEVPRYAAEAALDQFGLDPTRPTVGLSGGETRRASIARAFAAAPDVLLLDEPTNHLDITTIELLERRLSAFSGACLIISHDKRFLERVTTRCFWLHQGKVLSSPEGFSRFDDWAAAVELEDERALSRLETHLKAEEHWLRRGVTARRSRNEGRRARLMQLRAERSARRQTSQSADARIAVEQGAESGRLVIEARGLTKTYPGLDRPLVKDLSLRVMRGDRVGIVGPNGAGKSTLIGLLLRTLEPDAGSVRHGANLQIVHVDQTRSTLADDVSVRDALTPGGGDQVMVRGRPRHVAAYAADFLFTPAQLRQPAGALSGGERNRLALAIALAQPANLLVLDEPTNDLDMDTLDVLTEALAAYEGAALIVSHDRAFLDDVTTQVLGALGGGRWAETPGGYADFEREHGGFARPEPPPPASKPAPTPSPRRSSTKLSYKEERRLAELEAAVPRLEAEIAALEAELADPGLYARAPERFTAAGRRLDAARAERDAAETEWLELEDKRSA